MAAAIRLYLDENLKPVIADQLRLRGIDAVSARDLRTLGDSDPEQFERAQAMGCVIVTSDNDFLRMASQNVEHCGIIFGRQQVRGVGEWVKALELVCSVYTADDMLNHVEYLW